MSRQNIQILIGVIGFLTWASMAYCDPSLRHDFLAFVITSTVGVVGLAVRDMKTVPDNQPKDAP